MAGEEEVEVVEAAAAEQMEVPGVEVPVAEVLLGMEVRRDSFPLRGAEVQTEVCLLVPSDLLLLLLLHYWVPVPGPGRGPRSLAAPPPVLRTAPGPP